MTCRISLARSVTFDWSLLVSRYFIGRSFRSKFCWVLLCRFWIQNSEVNNVKRKHNPKGNYKFECRATRTSDKCEGKIRCRGGVSIPCWPVTLAVRPFKSFLSQQSQRVQVRYFLESPFTVTLHETLIVSLLISINSSEVWMGVWEWMSSSFKYLQEIERKERKKKMIK